MLQTFFRVDEVINWQPGRAVSAESKLTKLDSDVMTGLIGYYSRDSTLKNAVPRLRTYCYDGQVWVYPKLPAGARIIKDGIFNEHQMNMALAFHYW